MMNPRLCAIAVIIVFAIIAIFIAQKHSAETFATTDCHIDGNIVLPYDPLARYESVPGLTTHFGWIGRVETSSPREIAQKCDETTGCVAFTPAGNLYAGVFPRESLPSGPGFYVRRCVEPEQLYIELYNAPELDPAEGWALVPVGDYPDLNNMQLYASTKGVINGGASSVKRNSISSIRVPRGLQVTIFYGANFEKCSRRLGPGDYTKLKVYSHDCRLTDNNWNDDIASIKVAYSNSTEDWNTGALTSADASILANW